MITINNNFKSVPVLSKPITILININIKTWIDRTYGHSYSSGRVYINNNYDAPYLVYEYELDTSDSVYHCFINKLIELGIIHKDYNFDESLIIIRRTDFCSKSEMQEYSNLPHFNINK